MFEESLLLIVGLLFLVLVLVMLGQKLKVAYPIFLVISGLLISLIPTVPHPGISPDLIFLIFLPPLLYEAAWYTSWPSFWKMRFPIALHGFGLVIATSVIVAFVSEKLIPRFTLSIGLLLGGIISPPDAVAANSTLKFFKIPKNVKTVLEGESLVNDASSLTVFRFALAAVISGTFVFHEAAVSFIMVTLMGILIGLIIGFLIYFIHKFFLKTSSDVATALTLITPYVMYMSAEQFHYSGVLAVVTGGLFLSSRSHEILNHKARLQAHGVWATIVFILNGLIFILIGLQLPLIVNGLKYYTLEEAIRYGLIISGLIIAIRLIWIFIATHLPSFFPRGKFRDYDKPDPREAFLVGWAGMRGVVSLASALAIPVALADGSEFPERDLVLFISFIVILVTLVLQGLTLPWVIKKLNITEEKPKIPKDVQAMEIHLMLIQVSLGFLKNNHAGEISKNPLIKTLADRYENELGLAQTNIESLDNVHIDEKKEVREYNHMLYRIGEIQHRQLNLLRTDDRYDEDVIRREELRVDLDQNKIG